MRFPAKQSAPEVKALLLAVLLLVVGTVIYAFDRGGAVYFLPGQTLWTGAPAVFGALGYHLPSFLHPLAFILITAAVLRPWPGALPAICVTWFVVECLFELGQMGPFDVRIAAALSPWFDSVPILRTTADFFTHGTFDPLDVLSVTIGTLLAYPIALGLLRGESR